jgi:hypothetical protein
MTTNHHITIPGLDREKCDRCNRWICRDNELQRLKTILEGTKDRKAIAQLQIDYKNEVKWAKTCTP